MAVPWRVPKNWRQRRTNVTKVHQECNECFSSRQTTHLYEPVPDTPNVEVIVKSCIYEHLSHMASLAFRDAAIAEVPVYQHWAVHCSEEYMAALTSWEGSENPRNLFKVWVEEMVRPEVEAGSGLCWEVRTSPQSPRTSEKRSAIQRFRCQSELCITLDISTAICSVTCIHLEDHERPSWRNSKFPREALDFLDKVVEAEMMTADVYRLMRLQEHINLSHITKAHMNYWVAEIESWRYAAGEPDQLKSSKDMSRGRRIGRRALINFV
ncbi:hypothetical protein R1sor_001354 [Riccia sorocarpa]|uniref:Uncharacterized protein n=1 Tax=Riccia sorocarpa TaxID=122646 RepID=A0ABD3GYT8_9MARC